MIDQAFIPAAGFAKRMRPLTDRLPKPLLVLGDKPIITHIIDRLIEVGVTKIVMNGHHQVQKLHEYLPIIQNTYSNVEFVLSVEDDILETGGGAVQALQHLDTTKSLYMINGDAYWVGDNTLQKLSDEFSNSDNDMTLLLQSTTSMPMTEAKGDYSIDGAKAVRVTDKTGTHMFTGIRALHPRVLDRYNVEKFSFLKNMDETETHGKLGALNHDGEWYHISTPQDLDDVNKALFSKAS